jgi:hypothetical protein
VIGPLNPNPNANPWAEWCPTRPLNATQDAMQPRLGRVSFAFA